MNENPSRLNDHEDFVHIAVHELKTPVTVLKAYIQLIESKLSKDPHEETLAIIEKMDGQLDKLLNLIADLSDAAHFNAGAVTCLMNNFGINDCILDCVDGVKAANPACYIECELESANPVIKGDRDRIDQVITNLIGNAIKYSPHEKYVKIISAIAHDHLVVKVVDKGIGIPLEQQKHVFERFYRGNMPTGPMPSGLGLGLFIAAEIIKKHQGKMGLESETGKGSVFWFSLPFTNYTANT